MSEAHGFEPTPILYVGVQTGCPACAAAEPEWHAFRARHPFSIFVIPLHLDRKEWAIHGWTPSATPGYALVVGGKLVKKKVGTMTADELDRWTGLGRAA